MYYEIVFTKQADKDIDSIKEYIYNDNKIIALNVIQEILDSISLLKNMPSLGRAGRVLRTRELVISKYPYIVPYQVRENIIYILRVLHSSRKWQT